jgi:hypothetical protein
MVFGATLLRVRLREDGERPHSGECGYYGSRFGECGYGGEKKN